jgi:hypothetical protein
MVNGQPIGQKNDGKAYLRFLTAPATILGHVESSSIAGFANKDLVVRYTSFSNFTLKSIKIYNI